MELPGPSCQMGRSVMHAGHDRVHQVEREARHRGRELHEGAGRDQRQSSQRAVLDRGLSPFHGETLRMPALHECDEVQQIGHIPPSITGPTDCAATRASAVMTGRTAAGTSRNTTTSRIRGEARAARSWVRRVCSTRARAA